MTAEPSPSRTLADLRKELKVTQKQLAHAMGVHVSTVKRIEARYPHVMLPSIQAYLKGLGGRVAFDDWAIGSIGADSVVANPETAATLKGLRSDRSRAIQSAGYPASPEELPLQGDQANASSTHPGGQVDHPDAEGDQAEGDDGHER